MSFEFSYVIIKATTLLRGQMSVAERFTLCQNCRKERIEFMEKVTMKDIADALNISRVTVSKAFNNQTGVSDSLRELIFEKAKELGYAKLPYQILEQPLEDQRTVS